MSWKTDAPIKFVVDISLNKPKTLDNPVPVTTFFKLPNIPI